MSEKDSIISSARTGHLWPLTTREDLYSTDAEALHEDFERMQGKLFVGEDEIDITVIEIKNGEKTYRNFTDLDTVEGFCGEETVDGAIRIVMMPQINSWGELEISRTAFQLLLTTFDISPGFWTVVKLFGFKKSADHESGGGFNEQIWDERSGRFGLSYCIKHTEEHGRPNSYDPWSLRQIGVHHEFHESTKQHTFIVLNPSDSLRQRLEGLTGDASAGDIHHVVLSAAAGQWNTYIDYLEGQCEDLSKKAVLSNIQAEATTTTAAWGFEVQFQDSQRIQKLQDTIHRVSHMLDLNLTIFTGILDPAALLYSAVPFSKTHQTRLSSLRTQTQVRRMRAESLLKRLDGISTLIRSILDALASRALQASSRTTAELALLAREDSKMSAIFAKKATQDGRTLKTITILTLIYLPASFVATLLGTQYVHVGSTRGRLRIDVDGEMWIFGILTIVLLLITLGSWFFWEWRNRVSDAGAASKEKSDIA